MKGLINIPPPEFKGYGERQRCLRAGIRYHGVVARHFGSGRAAAAG